MEVVDVWTFLGLGHWSSSGNVYLKVPCYFRQTSEVYFRTVLPFLWAADEAVCEVFCE